MSLIIGGVLGTAAIIYVLVALLNPERFS
ncbi:K(+)-transporting ATPase subunit F [Corynebacterium sp. 13CS0277]|nr:K(+)-transporting ATPase subunit F [Corynebacterium sp. 13CS0277]